MHSNGPARAWPIDVPAKGGAWLLVALLHLLAAWTLTRPKADAGTAGPPMTLVYITLPRLLPSPAAARTPPARTGGRSSTRPLASTSPRATDPAGTNVDPAAVPTVSSDDWSMPAAQRRDDGICTPRQ